MGVLRPSRKSILRLCAVIAGTLSLQVFAQTPAPRSGNPAEPWVLGGISVGRSADSKAPKTAAARGLAIRVGEDGEAVVGYDLDLCRILGAWAGAATWPPAIDSTSQKYRAAGNVAFTTGATAGFSFQGAPRTGKAARGKPANTPAAPAVTCKGFHVHGDKVILAWNVGGEEVLELPAYDVVVNGGAYFTRTFFARPSKSTLQILVAADPPDDNPFDVPTHKRTEGEVPGLEDKERIMQSTPWVHGGHGEVMIWAAGDPDGSTWRKANGQLAIEIPPHSKPATFQIAYWPAPANDPDGRGAPLFFHEPEIDLPNLVRVSVEHRVDAAVVKRPALHP
jgi:hypothetical protein